jgi:NAD(P)-dependent dehydrogenase (short-subunit alcohol dehydrogenase family)
MVVVGGGSGIGRAIALAAATAGARVTVVGRRRDVLEETARAASAISIHVADVSVETEVVAMYRAIGAFDYLACTATQGAAGRIGDVPNDSIAGAIATKLWAPYFLAMHGRAVIARDGAFVFFSGIRGARPTIGSAFTSMVNGGLEAFARALALELAPVRVNVVSPGIVDSGAFWDRLGEARRTKLFTDYATKVPAGRVGTPEDVAAATLFTLAAPFVTGTVVPVDGGGQLV